MDLIFSLQGLHVKLVLSDKGSNGQTVDVGTLSVCQGSNCQSNRYYQVPLTGRRNLSPIRYVY